MAGWRWARPFLGSALSVASIAWGQGAPVELPPVDVPLPAAPPPPESPVQRDPTGFTTVVDVDARRTEGRTLGALVGEAPGVVLQQTGGPGQSESLTLRGAASTGVLVLLDGIPLNGTGSIADLSLVPLPAVSRIEVLRGGAGARYGAGALGGVVNLVTRSADAPVVTADVGTGSFHTTTASATAAGPALGGTGLLEAHVGHSAGNFPYVYEALAGLPGSTPKTLTRENDASTWGGGLAKGQWSAGAWTVAGLAQGTALSRGLAGTVDLPTPDSHQDEVRVLASVRASRGFETGASLSLRADVRHDRSDFRGGLFAGGESTRLWQTAVTADAGLPLGTHLLSLTVSAGYARADASLGHPRWGVTSVSAQDEWRLAGGRVAVVPSLRLDQAGPFVGVSPKLGASWSLPAGFAVQANVGESFRPPSFQELYLPSGTVGVNPDLVPERATSADLGVSWTGARASARVAGFAAQYRDLVVYEYFPPSFAKPRNVGGARAGGAELEATATPAPWLSASASYALLFTQDTRDVLPFFGQELPYRPRHRGTVRIDAGPERVRVHGTFRGQSEMAVTRRGFLPPARTLAGRVVVDTGVDVLLWRRPDVVLSGVVTNVGDVQAQDLDAYPLPGRAYFATLTVRFGAPGPSSPSSQGAP